MKNEKEIQNQLKILKKLDEDLDEYTNKIDELVTNEDLENSIRKCEPKKRAEIYWTAAYGIYTNTYLNLLLEENDPSLHSIKGELERLKHFNKKLNDAVKNVEGKNKEKEGKEENINDEKKNKNNIN